MLGDAGLHGHHEVQRNAYNAAFHELGFRWHWDHDTYRQLMQRASTDPERIRHYLQTHQAHLLRAYDANFLVSAIEAAKVEQARRGASPQAAFDWSRMRDSELGV